ncbi:MAG: OmpA family protein [Flavobacteriales bacterium]
MKMRIVIMTVAVLCSASLFAQTKKPAAKPTKDKAPKEEPAPENTNLVPNGGFEVEGVKSLKAISQLTEFCPEWLGPNKTPGDLFHKDCKTTKAGAPENDYGCQEPMNEGNAYAGFRAYTKDPKKTRTYLQVKLNKKMENNKLYCVRFNLSLAECSKFGVNNVGIFISDRKVQNPDDNALSLEPQVMEKTNQPIVTTDGWETICTTVIGTGKEEYIIIGGFGAEDKMKMEKVKKSGSCTKAQTNEAYYYIDDVEIFEVQAGSQCFCGKAEDREPELIYSRASAKNPNMKPAEVINNTTIYFAALTAEISSQFATELDEIAALMQANPMLSIELTGHSDNDEVAEVKLNVRYGEMAKKRAEAIKKYLADKGVAEGRISVVSKDNNEPANTKPTRESKAQNRRVECKAK